MREEIGGKGKDLYYLYYVLRFTPNIEQINQDLVKLRMRKKEAEAIKRNINDYFADFISEGVLLIEKEFGPDYLVDDLRKDIYERICRISEI